MSCCPPVWYCVTGSGLVEVTADEDGVYTPPDGWTRGMGGPYPSREFATGDCGCPVVVPCGEEEVSLPSGWVVSVTDQQEVSTGDPVTVIEWNSYELPVVAVGEDELGDAVVTWGWENYPDVPVTPPAATDVRIGWACAGVCPKPEGGPATYDVTVSFAIYGDGYILACDTSTSPGGWTPVNPTTTGGLVLRKCLTEEEINDTIDMGVITFCIYVGSTPPSVSGPYSMRVILVPN